MSLCDTTSYEVQTFKGNDPFKRSIAIQSFWNMDEMKRVKETSPFARVAKSNEHPKLQSTNTINLKKFRDLFVNINKYQLSISFLAHLCDGPGRTWLRPDAHLLLRPSQIRFVSVPWPGSGLCIICKARGHGIVHVDLPCFGVLQDDMGRMTFTLWYAGSISDHNWNRRLEVLREKPWSVLRVFAQQAAQSRCALLQCGGNMHKKFTNITSYKCDESSQWPALQPLQPPDLPFSCQARETIFVA